MHWNHRVVRHRENDECFYQIHEVYYEKGQVKYMTKEAITPSGDTQDELREDLERMLEATKKPVLIYEDY